MFKRFGNLFGSKSTEPSDESNEGDIFSELRWLEAAANPFGIRVLDCRPVVLGLTSTTSDPTIAMRFAELRSSTGTEYFGEEPNDAIHSECELTYPMEGRPFDGPVFVADEMEDKWNIYLHSGYFYFARSWSGILVSRARVTLVGSEAHVASVDVDRNMAVDAAFAVRHVDYLIKSHVYNKVSPHPVSPQIQGDRDIAMYSFSTYGRRGQFASYEDTTPVKVF